KPDLTAELAEVNQLTRRQLLQEKLRAQTLVAKARMKLRSAAPAKPMAQMVQLGLVQQQETYFVSRRMRLRLVRPPSLQAMRQDLFRLKPTLQREQPQPVKGLFPLQARVPRCWQDPDPCASCPGK